MKDKAVAVIGGGIAGIQASLDMAEQGYKVHLIEKSTSIGGKMALLDKTFPTMDCAVCIFAPKMIEASRHPNIELITNAEVTSVEGEAGRFNVTVKETARYVDVEKCTGCGTCAEKCPTKVPSEFDQGLGTRKAIYVPFPQAVPLIYKIDKENCLFFKYGGCKLCEKNCPTGAIDYEQEPERLINLDVDAIIVATGLEPFDPSPIKEYGYRRFKNVITALELERLVTATGPTTGDLIRPSDMKHPHHVTFIQCVGSRTLTEGYPYCSSVCCMHATKEAILVTDHLPDSKVDIFYTDIRAFGKQFKEFTRRAEKEYGVNYIRAKPGEIREDPETKNLEFWYEDTITGEVKHAHTDLLVLSTALLPTPGNHKLSETLGVEVDEYGFFVQPDPIRSPLSTTRNGIYVCGYSQGPKDIPDTIAEASGVASMVLLTKEAKPEGGK